MFEDRVYAWNYDIFKYDGVSVTNLSNDAPDVPGRLGDPGTESERGHHPPRSYMA